MNHEALLVLISTLSASNMELQHEIQRLRGELARMAEDRRAPASDGTAKATK